MVAAGPTSSFVFLQSSLLFKSTPPSASSNPESSQPSPRITDTTPEPSADKEFTPAAVEEDSADHHPESEPQRKSDQVCEPATAVPVGVLVELDNEEEWLINCETETQAVRVEDRLRQWRHKGLLMRSLAVVVFASVIWTITVSAEGKGDEKEGIQRVITCCTAVSRLTREQFTDPIIGFRLLKKSPSCLKAVIFKTERGEFCFDWRLPWVQEEVKLLRAQNKRLTSTPPPASSISKPVVD
ncbi:unnamed protein product [Leuciscus chuanchicus]